MQTNGNGQKGDVQQQQGKGQCDEQGEEQVLSEEEYIQLAVSAWEDATSSSSAASSSTSATIAASSVSFSAGLNGDAPTGLNGDGTSAIAAICCDGLVEYELVSGTVDGEQFLQFVQCALIPQMSPFDGLTERSIAILDNCSVHHVSGVIEEFRKAGIMVLFLPPYSPDYMPIELCFSYIKYYLKCHDDLLQVVSSPKVIIKSAFESVSKEQCVNWIKKCCYE